MVFLALFWLRTSADSHSAAPSLFGIVADKVRDRLGCTFVLGALKVTNSTKPAFYVCVYLKDGTRIGHAMGVEPNFPKKMEEEDGTVSQLKRSGLLDIWHELAATLMGYLEYVPMILEMAPIISHRMVTHSFETFLERNCLECVREETRTIYAFELEKASAINRFHENLSAASSTSRSLPRLLTVGLVTSLEYHVALIMKEIAAHYPEAIFGKDKTLLVKDVLRFTSMEEVREHVLNEEIDKAQRENFASQIDWIIKKTNMEDFRPKYAEWANIIELSERRNLFVHTNGSVNAQYLKAADTFQFPDVKDIALGKELHAGPNYFTASVHRVFHFAAMLVQIVWRKLEPDEADVADKAITDLGYELIVRGQYKLAARILEFATSLRKMGEVRQRMAVVNLANAQKLDGDSAASEKTLSTLNWEATSPDYRISVAAVRGDVAEVVRLMKKMGKGSDITIEFYQEWPVFYGVREDAQFAAGFKEVFGIDFVPSAKRQAGLAQVLEWISENRTTEQDGNSTVLEFKLGLS